MSDLRGDPVSMYCDLCGQMKGITEDYKYWWCVNEKCDRFHNKHIEEYFRKIQ